MFKSSSVISSEILEEFSTSTSLSRTIEKYFLVGNLFVFDTPNHRFGTQTDINSLYILFTLNKLIIIL